jgi:hypothetical protein
MGGGYEDVEFAPVPLRDPRPKIPGKSILEPLRGARVYLELQLRPQGRPEIYGNPESKPSR